MSQSPPELSSPVDGDTIVYIQSSTKEGGGVQETREANVSANLLNDQYELGRELGKGSYGTVLIAVDTRNGNRRVAIKVLDEKKLRRQRQMASLGPPSSNSKTADPNFRGGFKGGMFRGVGRRTPTPSNGPSPTTSHDALSALNGDSRRNSDATAVVDPAPTQPQPPQPQSQPEPQPQAPPVMVQTTSQQPFFRFPNFRGVQRKTPTPSNTPSPITSHESLNSNSILNKESVTSPVTTPALTSSAATTPTIVDNIATAAYASGHSFTPAFRAGFRGVSGSRRKLSNTPSLAHSHEALNASNAPPAPGRASLSVTPSPTPSTSISRSNSPSRPPPVPSASAPVPATITPPDENDPMNLVREEIAIMKKLVHPNIVRLYEVLHNSADKKIYMVYELLEKGPVMEVKLEGSVPAMSEADARFYFRQLILGIEYLHEHEIAHRDIKPDNLLVSHDNVLKIVDFGVSEIFAKGSDKTRKAEGTAAFFSPELCTPGHGEISAKAVDVWAMGVTLYCFTTGRLPFKGASLWDLYEDIKNSAPDLSNQSFSANLADLLGKLLNKDPIFRISVDDIRVFIRLPKS
ncbi:kinase-like protein [Rhizoclosmatium globosum]|uniref:Kinase-like protein n=1 Tax=Rhizoclosmatium globosum TaxID=329046 RepID=A0A1Y2D135_9FUNG|nr:kinase-like protein [Rhizoclosmatium globosum]|eukprot:ORY52993.1 kinase-like protein [Rhizoclosmatium globosum]